MFLKPHRREKNGIPDAAEFMVLETVLGNGGYNLAPNGGVGHDSVYAAWTANLAQAEVNLPSASASIQRAIAAHMTIGADGHTSWAIAAAFEAASVTLNAADYAGTPGLRALGNADGDRV